MCLCYHGTDTVPSHVPTLPETVNDTIYDLFSACECVLSLYLCVFVFSLMSYPAWSSFSLTHSHVTHKTEVREDIFMLT